MAERSKAAVLKTVESLRAPGVRIPLSPFAIKEAHEVCFFDGGEEGMRTPGFDKSAGMPIWAHEVRVYPEAQGCAESIPLSPFVIKEAHEVCFFDGGEE